MSESTWVDVLDPDYRSHENVMERRINFFASMLSIEALARRLSQQADEEYQRSAAETPEERERREGRERTLRDLVIRANETGDPGLWRQVDAMVFGLGAE